MELESVKSLMRAVIDYAGLFPPAGLEMTRAVANYRRYGAGPEQWMLGHFVIPVTRLPELQSALIAEPGPGTFRVSAISGGAPADDVPAILAFNAHVREARIDSVEARPAAPEAVREQAGSFPDGFTVYWEVPWEADPSPWLEAIASAGQRAKIRTGGLAAAQFPSAAQVARFIKCCDLHGTPFKATAGLHHAAPGTHALTYEPQAPTCAMHGFLNVLLAAAFLWASISEPEMTDLLADPPDAFRFSRMGVAWRHHWIGNAQIRAARERLAIAFGSCSFEDPATELTAMRLL